MILGVVLACFSASIGGSTFVFIRLVIDQTDPITLNFLRFGSVGIILFIFFVLFYSKMPMRRADLLKISMIGLLFFAAFPILCAYGLELTTAARGGLIYATMPIVTMILAAIFKIEKLTLIKTGAVLLAVCGILLALGDQQSLLPTNKSFQGDILLMGSVLCSSIFVVFSGNFMKKYGNLRVQVIAITSGVTLSFFLTLVFGQPIDQILNFDNIGWFSVLFLILPGGVLMMYCWGKALMLITPTQAAISLGFNPIVAMLLGIWLLDEVISSQFLIGFFLLFIAIIVCNKQ
jgi:drug/metabolite transporter (DMT)-like permease